MRDRKDFRGSNRGRSDRRDEGRGRGPSGRPAVSRGGKPAPKRPGGASARVSSVPERVQKLLARLGVASRRQVEAWIVEGRLKINGKVAEAGAAASAADQFQLDDKPLRLRHEAQPRVLAYRKRVGEIVTRDDPEGRRSVFDRLPRLQGGRWIAVGRLDINTSGLLLFTTDGELASRLMHPSYEIEREYAVRVLGGLTDEALQELRKGVELDDGFAQVRSIQVDTVDGSSANLWYRLVLSEGRNREVRRMIEAVGGQVSRLMRVRYGPVTIPGGVPSGRGKELDVPALEQLYAAVDLKVPKRALERASRGRR